MNPADKPLLRTLTPVLRPLFAANHHWAMAKGEESLRLELARRQATTLEEWEAVPLPPLATGPTTYLGWVAALAALVGLIYIFGRLRRRQR